MKKRSIKTYSFWIYGLFLASIMQTSWAEEARVYYTYDRIMRTENVKMRWTRIDMNVQKFLETLTPPLPLLDAQTVWTLATKDMVRAQPGDLVVTENGVPTGKTVDNPWIITRVAVG